jgi:hypothetical protein
MKMVRYKVFVFGCGLSIYLLMIAAVAFLLSENEESKHSSLATSSSESIWEDFRTPSLMKTGVYNDETSAILLPLGPEDGRLPGSPTIWKELLAAEGGVLSFADGDGFSGLQAVNHAQEITQKAIVSLFLSDNARQVFRFKQQLLILNDQGNVQIVNCENPREPKLIGTLPYHHVRHMEREGNTAFLLLARPVSNSDSMVIINLEDLPNPRELVQFGVPKNALSFFRSGRRLVVYVEVNQPAEAPFAALYDLTWDNKVIPAGFAACPTLINGFLTYGDYLLTPDLRSGLHIHNVSDLSKGTEVAYMDLPGQVRYLVQHGEKIYALDSLKRIHVIDLHDPEHPKLLRTLEDAEYPYFLLKVKDCMYYFSLQGFLYVLDSPLVEVRSKKLQGRCGLEGALLPLQAGAGFTLLGRTRCALPDGVDRVLPRADEHEVIDAFVWQDGLVTLQANGQITFFRMNKGNSPEVVSSLQLPRGQRWLAPDRDHLYVGGSATVSIIARERNNQLALTGQMSLPVENTWDGLIVDKTLCIAAGTSGLMNYSLTRPGNPTAMEPLKLPLHLESLVDIRQLVNSGARRLLAAAGAVGLLDGRIEDNGQYHLDGLLNFPAPVTAIAVINRLCLAATKNEIHVVDTRDGKSLQNLGKISLPGVTRLAVASPEFWAGFVPGAGWSVLPAPSILSPDDFDFLSRVEVASIEPTQTYYRLNLFDDHYVTSIPGLLRYSTQREGRTEREGLHDN